MKKGDYFFLLLIAFFFFISLGMTILGQYLAAESIKYDMICGPEKYDDNPPTQCVIAMAKHEEYGNWAETLMILGFIGDTPTVFIAMIWWIWRSR